ncbi:MAG: glycosyltransferase family A protein [Dermatophilaceae bacterium]
MRPLRPSRPTLWRTPHEPVTDVIVAIPAQDEEALLGSCLDSVTAALTRLRRRRAGTRTTVVVALDGCSDGSALIAATHGALMVELDGVGVGLARDAAIETGLMALGRPTPETTWIACTDADTVVHRSWLHRQVGLADRGIDLVIGTVEPFGVESEEVLQAWYARHALHEGHGHVHGANLGLRASRWLGEGGFGEVRVGEDVGLVEKIRTGRARWLATDTTRVRTSGRLLSRVDSGFAEYLRAIDAAEVRPAVRRRVRVPTAGLQT